MAIENTVSTDFLSAFFDCKERFRLSPIRYDLFRLVITKPSSWWKRITSKRRDKFATQFMPESNIGDIVNDITHLCLMEHSVLILYQSDKSMSSFRVVG